MWLQRSCQWVIRVDDDRELRKFQIAGPHTEITTTYRDTFVRREGCMAAADDDAAAADGSVQMSVRSDPSAGLRRTSGVEYVLHQSGRFSTWWGRALLRWWCERLSNRMNTTACMRWTIWRAVSQRRSSETPLTFGTTKVPMMMMMVMLTVTLSWSCIRPSLCHNLKISRRQRTARRCWQTELQLTPDNHRCTAVAYPRDNQVCHLTGDDTWNLFSASDHVTPLRCLLCQACWRTPCHVTWWWRHCQFQQQQQQRYQQAVVFDWQLPASVHCPSSTSPVRCRRSNVVCASVVVGWPAATRVQVPAAMNHVTGQRPSHCRHLHTWRTSASFRYCYILNDHFTTKS